ncbi:MAG: NAD(P)-dependent oxidoreductase [Bacteroidota bacterium]
MENILVALSTFAEFDSKPMDVLKASGVPYQVHSTGKRITKAELLTNAKDATVIIAGVEPYDVEVLSALTNLKCIVRCGVGVDAVDLIAAKEKNITVLNTPDVPTIAVAELALALYFSLSRNLRVQANSMGHKKWERLESHLLSGKTIGIIGFGRIGRKIAEFCKPFGVRILVQDPFISKETVEQVNATWVDKETLLKEADIISIHASKSDNLIIGKTDYAKMKKGALLVNLSRGGMIDEDGLLEALQSKHLAGAGLDVFGTEPYNGPLCDLENVILTPHSATMPVETRVAMELEAVDKALRFLRNQLEPNEKVI